MELTQALRLRHKAFRLGITTLLALALVACAGNSPMFDEMTASVHGAHEVVDLTYIALRYVPLGSSEGSAEALLTANGFAAGDRYATDEFDKRAAPSDYYVAFRRSTRFPALSSNNYVVALGVTDGKVDFVSSESKPSPWP